MNSLVYLLFLASLAFSSPVIPTSRRGNSPTVVTTNGTVVGTSLLGVESFKGIPYAQPPVGQLRLRPPLPLETSFGTFTSQLLPNACPQFWSQIEGANLPEEVVSLITDSDLFQKIAEESEDCLTLNIQRPSGTTASSKLPVVVWIFGGAFEIGSTTQYDGSKVVTQSVDHQQPIIYVSVNYRLNGFGFLPGKEVAADGSSNLGLRDQRLALEWIQDNIAAFGGDPTKVTLWGESAGAISICDQTIINGGDISYNGGQLFRGAIMNSGSTTPSVPIDHPKAQKVYDTVASAGGCSNATDSLNCLRSLPYQEFLDAISSVPSFFSYQSVDLSYLPRPDPSDNFLPDSPEVLVKSGNYAKIPLIIGDQADEGTLFSLTQSNISTSDELVQYIMSALPLASEELVSSFVGTYPDNASAGSPFNTGIANNWYPQFKRLAALMGDFSFTLQRRAYLSTVSSEVTTWSYLANYFADIPVLGTYHASDIMSTYYDIPTVLSTDTILQYYISFINNLDPNTITPKVQWPQYKTSSLQMLEYGQLSQSVITDDFRQTSYEFLLQNQEILRV